MNYFSAFITELDYAYNNVPFYHKKLTELGIVPGNIKTEQDLARLPFTTKTDFRKNFPKGILAEGFTLNHPMVVSSRSSGTTGERLITIELGMFLLQRALQCAQVNPAILSAFSKEGRKIARFAAPNCSDVECANPNSSIEDRILADNTLVLPVYHDLLTTSEAMIDRAIEEISSYQPDMFYVDPTHFAFLLRQYQKRGLTPPDIPCMTSYTAASHISRRQIKAFYPHQSHYGELLSSTEFGWIAMTCPHGNMHLNQSSFFFEYLPVALNCAEDNALVELCISSLDQGASPHLRYRTGDIVSLVDGTCPCGSAHQSINMHGKACHFLSYNQQPLLSPRQVDDLLGDAPWLDLYQLDQRTDTEYFFKMIVNSRYQAGMEADFLEAFRAAAGIDLQIEVSVVDYIATERSGKFQTVRRAQ
ncbi:hypothetical protein [Thalassomonas sp. RHCl1]|uniref:phenylacetate--CoA ligase family protein n=1 Tax=Thalassomonas sp. RHCl1 TaxID=2995320 RepID=UPI00248C9520|nr:hypothetical protein [Thalassomonas sp. RHCl1]